MLNRLGSQTLDHKRPPAPITIPVLNLPPVDDKIIEAECRQAQARVRVIRAGRDAWAEINKAASFESWLRIGHALSIGKAHALRVSGVRQAWGRAYGLEFGAWIKAHGFEKMAKSVRSVAIELHENAHAIEQWRSTLDERTRRRLVHPLSNVRRWRASDEPVVSKRIFDAEAE